ncbi:Uu.00g073320.m01.CDS01 [Anthostomella pinea]|uniref:Uu.00g073320.m01.CDS01 n=1 Tax=Anthostomella pinea TaxID=933095 RepID=A0AAI8VV91_9PEZI|nr:Uu.00g073320.m01.CDS01 [Anthostomella pinea]
MHSLLHAVLASAALVGPVAVWAKAEQIRAVSDPIFHLYLQAYPEDPTIPVMGPEASSEYYTIAGTIQSTNSSAYLDIAGADTTSYKTLSFSNGSSAATSAWALEGDTIITSTSSDYGRQLNFLACQMTDNGERYAEREDL